MRYANANHRSSDPARHAHDPARAGSLPETSGFRPTAFRTHRANRRPGLALSRGGEVPLAAARDAGRDDGRSRSFVLRVRSDPVNDTNPASGTEKHAIVIGGGVGGLSTAIRLRARGARVTLLEKNARVGGKLNRWEVPHPHRPNDRPFRFDTGPSLLTMPFVFQDLFAAAGADVRDYLEITRLDPVSRFVWADGQTLELTSDATRMREQLQQFAPRDVDGFERLLDRGKHIWDLAGEFFLMNAPEQLMKSSDRKLVDGLRMATIPFRIGMFEKFSRCIDRYVKTPRLREVLYQYATYSGASPFLAPATLAVIPYVELGFGGWYPRGGTYAIAEALEKLATSIGVDIRTNATVARITIASASSRGARPARPRATGVTRGASPAATGVELSSGQSIRADVVICNADVVWAYQHLIAPEHRPHYDDAKLKSIEPGGSGMVLMLGVDGTYPQLAHHTKFMPADYTSDLRAMFETKTIPDDPCVYVCATTRTDASQAPEGCENLFVLCSAPALDGAIDWAIEGPRYERQVIETLESRFGLTDLSKRIVVRRRMTPADLAADYNAYRGSIYGISSNGLKAAFLRPPNRDKRIAGLYFAGGATHPGGGLPLVALSGKIASEMAGDDLGLTRDSIESTGDAWIAATCG